MNVRREVKDEALVKTTEHGIAVTAILVWVMGALILVFAMVFNFFLGLREDSEQERLARSAAAVALRAYLRAGAQATAVPKRRQITYALDAAARVVVADPLTTDPIPKLSSPSQTRAAFEAATGALPSSPITVTVTDNRKDSAGDPLSEATVTLGSAAGGNGVYTLGPLSQSGSADTVIGVRVLIDGLMRSSRVPLFAGYFGLGLLNRSQSQVLVVYDTVLAQQNPNAAMTIIEER